MAALKEWFTNAELAALNIPGFSKTKRGVNKWFADRGLDALYPGKVRRRDGRGGGIERHVTLLPRPIRDYLAILELKTVGAPDMPPDTPGVIGGAVDSADLPDLCGVPGFEGRFAPYGGVRDIPEPPSHEAGALRRDAILLLLNFWDIFRSRFKGPVKTARHVFVALYRNGGIEGFPDWALAALTSRSGRLKGSSVTTLKSWERRRREGRFGDLAGDHGNRRGTGVLDVAEGGRVAAFIGARIVALHGHLTADHIRDLVRGAFGEVLKADGAGRPVPPLRTFQRFIAQWKETHAEALLKMTDPDGFKSRMRVSGVNMNHWVARPNQLWEVDASPADVLLTDGRYSIYAVVDIFTRRMMVSVTKTPRTAAVLVLLRRAVLAWGVPEIVRTDNGPDFISHQFKRALSGLGVHQDITDPFAPEQKGTVERHIGTLQRGLMPLLPGFIGHNVADRKQIEARRSFAERLGESDEEAFCVALGHEEFQAAIDRWLAAKYEHKAHAGLKGKTPFEAAAAWSGPIRTIENERALDMLLAPIAGKNGRRVVSKHGIKLDRALFMAPELVPGTNVFCRHDPEDMGRIYVYSADGREFICIAECPERLGADPGQMVRAMRAAQAERIRDEVEPLRREIRAMKPRDMIDRVLEAAERDTDGLAAFPSQTEAYRSPGLDAADDAMRPKPEPAPLTEDAQAAADAAWEAMNRDGDNGNVVRLEGPVEAAGEAPMDDAGFVRWVRANPDKATDGQKEYAERIMKISPSLRMLVG